MAYFQCPLVADPLTGGLRPDMPPVDWSAAACSSAPAGAMIVQASDADAAAILAQNPATVQMPAGWKP